MRFIRKDEWLLIQIDEEFHLKTISEFLDAYVIAEEKRRYYMDHKMILLNRMSVQENTLMRQKDTLQIKAFIPQEVDIEPSETEAEVVYEDDFLLVVNKPSGILIYSDQDDMDTLDRRVAAYYCNHNLPIRVRHLHRLDRETCGLVMYSKCEFFQAKLDRMMYEKKIHRIYYAFVEGVMELDEDTISAPIGQDRHVSNKMRVSPKTGKRAVTHYRVVRRKKQFSLLEVKLDTGRTHQIRVHMAYIGHPIVNDTIYGRAYENLPMGLQAYKIEMNHLLDHHLIRIDIPRAF